MGTHDPAPGVGELAQGVLDRGDDQRVGVLFDLGLDLGRPEEDPEVPLAQAAQTTDAVVLN